MQNLTDHEETSQEFGYVVEISDAIHTQMDKHINNLKKFDIRHSMQSWALEAIREKIQAEKNSHEEIPKTKFLKLIVSERLRNYIDNRIKMIKGKKRSYSKKKWILDAISEKLERDQKMVSTLMEDIYSKN